MHNTLPDLVAHFVVARRADGRAPRTLADYARVLMPFVSWCASGQIVPQAMTRDDIRAYVASLQAPGKSQGQERGWSPATVAIHIRNLRAFLRWLNTEGHTEHNLALAVKAPRQTTRLEIPITPAEIQALLDTCASSGYHDRRDRALILVLADTGLRTGELVGLRVGHWKREPDTDGSYLLVYAPKSRSFRYAILGCAATSALVDYLALRPALPDDAPLFAAENGEPLKVRAVGSLLVRRSAGAGLARGRCHPHIFRKAFVTGSLDNGMDAERVRVLAGWSSMAMMRVYADSSLTRLRNAHRRAGPVDKMGLNL